MKPRTKRMALTLVAMLISACLISFKINFLDIPKTWDVDAIEKSHLPPPDSAVQIHYAPESYYNSLPEHEIYKTYPVYAQEFEPQGYIDSLRELEPQIVFDPNNIKTQEDWINAGEKVFFWPANFNDPTVFFGVIDSAFLKASGDHITAEGIYPFFRYVIKEKGQILLGDLSCANCHTRVTEKGEVIIGAQGNHAFDASFGYFMKKFNIPAEAVNKGFYQLAGTPWADKKDLLMNRTQEEVIARLTACPNGVISRQGMAADLPLRVPSLIGIKDMKYLDHTGLMIHRSPEDLMRYAALNQGMDLLTSYNGFIPMGVNNFSELPTPTNGIIHLAMIRTGTLTSSYMR